MEIPLQIGTFLERQAQVNGSHRALSLGEHTLSYAALEQAVTTVAHHLASRGMGVGARIALMADNGIDFILLLLATARCGAIIVPLNVRLSAAEIAYIIADISPQLIVYSAPYEDVIRSLPGERSGATLCSLDALTLPPSLALPPYHEADAITLDRPWIIIPTAAVQGEPRGAVLTQYHLLATALQLASLLKLTEEDRHLCLLPLFHIGGIAFFLATLLVGGQTVLRERFHAPAVPNIIIQEGITFFITFPPMLASILEAAQPVTHASLRLVGGVDSPETIAQLTATYPQASFINIYGQTECMPIAGGTFTGTPGVIGPSTLLTHLTIRDEEDRALPPGEVGEICVRSPAVFAHYWQRAEETRYTLRGGWHHTGDLGSLDGEGRLTFKGRKPEKDLIKTGGENVYPQEVESVLRTHEAVREACVFGLPDQQWGEAVCALCVLSPEARVTEEELVAYVAQRIARYKKPRHLFFVASLPRHPQGTIDRQAAKELGEKLLRCHP